MPRKTSKLQTRVYKFGCLPPTIGADLIDAQIRSAHVLHNQYIELERERKTKQEVLLNRLPNVAPKKVVYDTLSTQLGGCRDAIKGLRAKQQHPDLALLTAQAKDLNTRQKAAQKELYAEKRIVNPVYEIVKRLRKELKTDEGTRAEKNHHKETVVTPAIEAEIAAAHPALLEWWKQHEGINAAAYLRQKELSKASDANWGCKADVKAAVDATLSHRELPRFKPYDGTGCITVQTQGGLTRSELFSCEDTVLQATPVADEVWAEDAEGKHLLSAGERKRRGRGGVVRMRIASDGKKPVWVELPVIWHRPLPEDVSIKWARIFRTKDGPARTLTRNGQLVNNWKWNLQLTVESESFSPPETKVQRIASLAIDLGWRAFDGGEPLPGIRVGYWKDTQGGSGELKVPEAMVRRLEYASTLRGIKDGNFNVMKAFLANWLEQNRTILPDWLKEAAQYVSRMKTAWKLVRLHSLWTKQRFPGDTTPLTWIPAWRESALRTNAPVLGQPAAALPKQLDILGWLTEWRRQDEHLWTWEANQRSRLLGHRRDLYRNWAADFAQRYGRIVVEDMDLRDFATYPNPEDGPKSEDKDSRAHRTQVAPSEFREALEKSAAKRGAEYVYVPPKNTTRTCSECGFVNTWKAKSKIHHTCQKCKVRWDQDANAAQNLVRLGASGRVA